MVADLVIFDPARIEDRATYAKPHQFSGGFDFVFVNGKIAIDNNKLADTRAGKPLKNQ